MKHKVLIIIITFFCFAINEIRSQDCIFYEGENHTGKSYNMPVGASEEVNISKGLSWELSNKAAIRIIDPSPPYGNTTFNRYPWRYVYATEDADYINGSNNWDDIGQVIVTCENKCDAINCMPQPSTWIPVDYTDINHNLVGDINDSKLGVGDTVLVLRKAFLYENSEDVGGIHGPYGSVSIHCRTSNLFNDYNNSASRIEADYNEDGDWIKQYESVADVRLPGQVYHIKSEWIDGPWGACYSRVIIFNWDKYSNNHDSISVFIREGDAGGLTDDFMGGQIVNKHTKDPILIKAWMYGWFVVENIVLTQNDMIEDISDCDFYWNHSWNGLHPEIIRGKYMYDQYNPLPNNTIDEMQKSFEEGSKVGLLGGTFPIGVLDKPMVYTAPCDPAVFKN